MFTSAIRMAISKTGHIKTGARARRTITGHNSTSNKTETDQRVQTGQAEPGLVEEGEGKKTIRPD